MVQVNDVSTPGSVLENPKNVVIYNFKPVYITWISISINSNSIEWCINAKYNIFNTWAFKLVRIL